MKNIKKLILSFFLALHFSKENTLLLNAAALTFYFILSLVPIFLIILTISNLIALSNIDLLYTAINSLKNINEDAVSYFYKIIDNSKNLDIFSFGLTGIISIFFTSLLFSKSLTLSFRKILNIQPKKIISIIAPFILNISGLIILVLALVLKVGLAFIKNILINYVNLDLSFIISVIQNLLLAPMVLIFITVLLSYYILSNRKLSFNISIIISIFYSLVLYGLNYLFSTFVNLNYYKAVYGQIGLLIFSLYWLYLIFIFYLFFLQVGICLARNKYFAINYILNKGKSEDSIIIKIFGDDFLKNTFNIDNKDDFEKLDFSEFIIIEGYVKIQDTKKVILKQAGDIIFFDKSKPEIIEMINLKVTPLSD